MLIFYFSSELNNSNMCGVCLNFGFLSRWVSCNFGLFLTSGFLSLVHKTLLGAVEIERNAKAFFLLYPVFQCLVWLKLLCRNLYSKAPYIYEYPLWLLEWKGPSHRKIYSFSRNISSLFWSSISRSSIPISWGWNPCLFIPARVYESLKRATSTFLNPINLKLRCN